MLRPATITPLLESIHLDCTPREGAKRPVEGVLV